MPSETVPGKTDPCSCQRSDGQRSVSGLHSLPRYLKTVESRKSGTVATRGVGCVCQKIQSDSLCCALRDALGNGNLPLCSLAYIRNAAATCRTLLKHLTALPCSLAAERLGSR